MAVDLLPCAHAWYTTCCRACAGPMASIEAAAGSPYSPIGSGVSNIVQARGGNFMLGDNVIYPAGTSWCARHGSVAHSWAGACMKSSAHMLVPQLAW